MQGHCAVVGNISRGSTNEFQLRAVGKQNK